MYLFMCKSLTYAQRSARLLERRGISGAVVRAPRELSGSGCGYCVRVAEKHRITALETLRAAGLPPQRVYRMDPDGYTEVTA